MNTKYD